MSAQTTSTTTTYQDPVAATSTSGAHEDGSRRTPPPAGDPPETPKKGGFLRKLIIVLVILGVVGGAAWKIYKNQQETAAAPTPGGRGAAAGGGGPTPVLVAAVQKRTVPVYLTALGTVTAYNTVTIKSRVDGQLLSVNVREGQAVKQGQLIAQIDPRPYQAALEQAQGQLTKDQANAANMNAEANRYKALYGAGVISKESTDAQVSNAGQASGSIQADQAAIDAAKVNVSYTRISSPINGVVGLRTVDAGNIVHASDATGLIVVTQIQPIAVIFTLPEDQLPQVLKLVRGGAKLTVEAYDRSETTHLATGQLLTVDNQIDTTTGTARIKAVFPNTDNTLFPNQFVNVRLILEQRENALVVPSAAVQTSTNGTFVYVVREGNPPADAGGAAGGGGGRRGGGGGGARRAAAPADGSAAPAGQGDAAGQGAPGGANARPAGPPHYAQALPVKVDLTEGSSSILDGGVNAGDLVVIDGQERLRNNARVTPRQSDPAAGGGAGRRGGANGAPAGAGNGSTRTGDGALPGAPTTTTPGTPSGSAAAAAPGQTGGDGSGRHRRGQNPDGQAPKGPQQ